MSRYIDADALINTLGISDEEIDFKEILREAPTIEVVSVEDYHSMENTCYKLQKALYEMADAPSIDIEPKRGEWIYGEHDVAMCDGYRCNRCDFFVPWDYEHKFIDFINDYHFCPNCGARMKGVDDDSKRL